MASIITTSQIDDLSINKFLAKERIGKVLSFVEEQKTKKLVKTASTDNNSIIELFGKMLSFLELNAKDGNIKDVLENLSKSGISSQNTISSGTKHGKERHEDIKIASKRVRDSHYQIDLSKDIITKHGKKIFMVSCYGRDAYLGRYLVKRNFYFTEEREPSADAAYDEILIKMNAIKNRYYEEVIDVPEISTQMKIILDGVISELRYDDEDVLATNIKR